ncbi:LOW QUALITY PROTEIN: hypothetical protein U9M48_001616, partial [Paspalum notatum var. saurae]
MMPKALLVALVALASTVDATFTFTDDDIDSEEALWELFGRWAAYHEVVREPGRFAAFKANVQWRRSKQRHSGRLMSLNVFGDRSFDEFAAQPCVVPPTPAPRSRRWRSSTSKRAAANPATTTLPSRVDWRDSNPPAVTDVKRQRRCGSCWAFAAAGAMEGAHAIETQSAAYLLDCTSEYVDKSCSCSGGNRVHALILIQKLGGIPSDSDYPYMGYQSQCDHHKFHWSATISEWWRIQSFNATELKLAVYLQPVSVNMGLDANFYHWNPTSDGSVYYGPGNTTVSHAVLIVGYDEDDLGLPYWIVKNSWGTRWGDDKGYINVNAEVNVGQIGKMGVGGILSNPIFVDP